MLAEKIGIMFVLPLSPINLIEVKKDLSERFAQHPDAQNHHQEANRDDNQ